MSDKNNKIIDITKYKRNKKNYFKFELKKISRVDKKMFFIVIIASALVASLLWDIFVENPAFKEAEIPESNNISYNNPIGVNYNNIADQLDKFEGKPILLYIYTTWCPVCSNQLPIINEISREFQNTDLKIITVATDKNLTADKLSNYLAKFGDIYFQPQFLNNRQSFIELLQSRKIKYKSRIPFTVLLSRDGKVIASYVGVKNKNYLRNKVIKELNL
jgi:thiol-disulfide isomerase/thioredoxin